MVRKAGIGCIISMVSTPPICRNVYLSLRGLAISHGVGIAQYDDHSATDVLCLGLRFKRKKTKVIVVMIVLNTIMWSLATSYMAVSFQQNFHAFLREHGADRPEVFEDNASPSIYSQLSLESDDVSIVRKSVPANAANDVNYSLSSVMESSSGGFGFYGIVNVGYSLYPLPCY